MANRESGSRPLPQFLEIKMKRITISILATMLVASFAFADLDQESGDIAYWGGVAIRSDGEVEAEESGTVSTNTTITSGGANDVNANQKVVITLADYSMSMVTNASAANCAGTVKLYDFEEGYLEVTGIHCNLSVINSESGVAADTTYDVGLGSTETDAVGGELDTSTDYSFLGKIEGDLSSYEADVQSQSITDVGVDGQTTAVDLWFNVSYLDADVTDESTATWNGTVTVFYRILGDD